MPSPEGGCCDRDGGGEVGGVAAELKPHEIFQASTGVIGEPLDPSFITKALPGLAQSAKAEDWAMAAKAIMTTDTFAKACTVKAKLGGKTVTINGIARRSCTIALAGHGDDVGFIFTDAAVPANTGRNFCRRVLAPA